MKSCSQSRILRNSSGNLQCFRVFESFLSVGEKNLKACYSPFLVNARFLRHVRPPFLNVVSRNASI